MYRLRELQRDFREALVGGGSAAEFLARVAPDGLAVDGRLGIYVNNVTASLSEALMDVYPAVCRLVHERFFAYAAHEFIRVRPPREPRLSRYGAEFPSFLESFPPARPLAYLADVARLEWLMYAAAHAPDAAPIEAAELSALDEAETPRLRLSLHPSLGHLESRWPVDAIWRANRAADAEAEDIDLNKGGVRLEIVRLGDGVFMRSREAGSYAFRRTLAAGGTLEAAAEEALSARPDFDVTVALLDLFRERLVTGFCLAPTTKGDGS